jgi:hypothetical protein
MKSISVGFKSKRLGHYWTDIKDFNLKNILYT